MSLTPPPDPLKVLVPLGIGAAISLVLLTLTRNNIPNVGDNIHSLPHGGIYRDGTKAIHYYKPQANTPAGALLGPIFTAPVWVTLAVATIPILVFIAVNRTAHRGRCTFCSGTATG